MRRLNGNGAGTMRSRTVIALAAATLLAAACQTLDVTNPNSPTEQTVLTDANGVLALGVGIQQQYAQGYISYLVPDALVTDEWGTKSRSLLSYQTLLTGGPNFDKAFDVVSAPYTATYRIALTADKLVQSAPGVGLSAGTQAGLIALARLVRAMALGNALQLYQQLPVNYVLAGATPQPRAVVLDTVLGLLEQARTGVASLSDADLSGLKSRVLGPGFDLKNTIDAMLARFYLIRGSYQLAIDAAGASTRACSRS